MGAAGDRALTAAWAPPPLPREHGAWVMLCLPLLLGGALAGARLSAAWLLPPAVALVFLAHCAAVPVVRRRLAGHAAPDGWAGRRLSWALLYLILAALFFSGLLIFTPQENRAPLLWLCGAAILCGAAYSVASIARADRLIGAELIGMAAMSLSAPIMAVASGRPSGMWLLSAPALAFGYSASTLAWVRAYNNLKVDRTMATLGCVVAHAVVLAGLALAGWIGGLPPLALLAFVPVLARTGWGLFRPPPTLKAVGALELYVVLLFAVVAVLFIA